MYAVLLDQNDITWLAFAAGIAAGSGNQAAHAALSGIISRVQDVSDEAAAAESLLEESASADDVIPGSLPEVVDPMFVPPLSSPPATAQADFGPGPTGGVLR